MDFEVNLGSCHDSRHIPAFKHSLGPYQPVLRQYIIDVSPSGSYSGPGVNHETDFAPSPVGSGYSERDCCF